jgi:hypothetical protein
MGEWKDAKYYNIPFWLNSNNSIDSVTGTRNVDGWNYISVAEDDDYYYIALDMCSDQTNNTDGEWIDFYLANRLPEFLSPLSLHALRDRGAEWICMDIDAGAPFPRSVDIHGGISEYNDIPIVDPADNVSIIAGETNDTYAAYWRSGDVNYTISSVVGTDLYNAAVGGLITGNEIIWEMAINITEKLPDGYEPTFFSGITGIDVNLEIGGNLTSIDGLQYIENDTAGEILVYLQPNMNHVDASDPAIFDAGGGEWIPFDAGEMVDFTLPVNPSMVNATTGMIYLTMIGYNELNSTAPAAYEVYIDKASLSISTKDHDSYVDTTVDSDNYDLAWGYGPSPNIEAEHRMYEFRVAKSEFPVLDPSMPDMLNVFIAGYGTLALEDTDFWIYPQTMEGYLASMFTGFPISDRQFVSFDMA